MIGFACKGCPFNRNPTQGRYCSECVWTLKQMAIVHRKPKKLTVYDYRARRER